MTAPCARLATEPPNLNPNNARMAHMTRDPARATSPNLPPHARERVRPTPRPPPRPSRRPSPRRATGVHQRRGRNCESERATGGVRRALAGWPTCSGSWLRRGFAAGKVAPCRSERGGPPTNASSALRPPRASPPPRPRDRAPCRPRSPSGFRAASDRSRNGHPQV